MTTIIEARGLACPQPVIKTKAALASGAGHVTTIVDSESAASNVSRMAQKAGWTVELERQADGVYVHMRREAGAAPAAATAPTPAASGQTVLVVASDRLGAGDDELGVILIRAFFHTLTEMADQPGTIIFLNSGVRLTCESSPILDDLTALAGCGIEILSCGTCLSFYALTETLRVGVISNMYTIAETLMAAGKVLRL